MNEGIYEQLSRPFPNNAYNVDSSRGFALIGIRGAFVIERLNEVFGIVGDGWRFAHSPFEEHGREIVTEVVLQYRVESGTKAYAWNPLSESFDVVQESSSVWSEPVYGVGGNQKGSGGVPMSDARKSAISAGLSKAASRIGVGVDAYKGNLVADGDAIVVKDDSGASPADSGKLVRKLLNIMFVSLPDMYDSLATSEKIAAGHRLQLVTQVRAIIKSGELDDFVTENITTIVGDNSVNTVEKLSAAQLSLLNNVVKSIIADEVTWKEALDLAGSLGEKTWKEAVAGLKDSAKDDDS